jgi:hypothetical protein
VAPAAALPASMTILSQGHDFNQPAGKAARIFLQTQDFQLPDTQGKKQYFNPK